MNHHLTMEKLSFRHAPRCARHLSPLSVYLQHSHRSLCTISMHLLLLQTSISLPYRSLAPSTNFVHFEEEHRKLHGADRFSVSAPYTSDMFSAPPYTAPSSNEKAAKKDHMKSYSNTDFIYCPNSVRRLLRITKHYHRSDGLARTTFTLATTLPLPKAPNTFGDQPAAHKLGC